MRHLPASLVSYENANEKAGVWVSAILGGVWSVVTYFVVPVLVVGGSGRCRR